MNFNKHAQKQLQYLLQPYVFGNDFPASEASRMLLWLYGDSIESIQSLSPTEITKAARQRLFEETEAKWINKKAKNKRAAERQRAKRQAAQQPQEAHEQIN